MDLTGPQVLSSMPIMSLHRFVLVSFLGLHLHSVAAADEQVSARQRNFLFTYAARITGLQPGQQARIWLPVPSSDADQDVKLVTKELPAEGRLTREPRYGNAVLYFEANADREGSIPISLGYRVTRREVKSDAVSPGVTKAEAALFLEPDAKVPIGGKPATLLSGKQLPIDQFQLARCLYDLVNEHMVYRKDKPGWGTGDASWACDSGFGNCSDFHSLFISLARTRQIPARFEIGFSLPPARGEGAIAGYHCWARFNPQGRGWIPVDISEANKVRAQDRAKVEYCFGNLTPDRIALSVGRDLVLVPAQDGPPLNFMVYPHVEAAGKPLPDEKVQMAVRFKDLGPGAR